MNKSWSEKDIRKEIKKMDIMTGLSGAELIIEFVKSKNKIGSFQVKNGNPYKFCFSKDFFFDETFPYRLAIDTIRHEYAHYMDFMKNGNVGHSKSWKLCCSKVNAMPIRICTKDIIDYFRKSEENAKQLIDAYNKFERGHIVIHPKFGKGIVEEVDVNVNGSILINFRHQGIKNLGLRWVVENCRICC